MHGGELIAIGATFIAVGIPIICGTIIAVLSILKGKPSKKDRIMGGQETLLIQEMHKGLTEMDGENWTVE